LKRFAFFPGKPGRSVRAVSGMAKRRLFHLVWIPADSPGARTNGTKNNPVCAARFAGCFFKGRFFVSESGVAPESKWGVHTAGTRGQKTTV
jgi:hypothetical protein